VGLYIYFIDALDPHGPGISGTGALFICDRSLAGAGVIYKEGGRGRDGKEGIKNQD